MPYPKSKRTMARRSKRTYRRRTYRRKNYRRSGYNVSKAPINTMAFPNKKLFKLRYSTSVTLNPPSGGTLAFHRFAANGLYDPDITGTGHQAYLFDEIMALYKRITVIGSKITCKFLGETTSGEPYVVGVYGNPSATPQILDYDQVVERGLSDVKFAMFDAEGGTSKPVTATASFSCKKQMSVKNPLDEPNLTNIVSANPTTLAYFEVFAGAANKSTDLNALRCQVVIDYFAVATQPITPGQS